jgi:hypothetical protein
MSFTLYEWVEKGRKELYLFKLTGEMRYWGNVAAVGGPLHLIEGSGPFDGES